MYHKPKLISNRLERKQMESQTILSIIFPSHSQTGGCLAGDEEMLERKKRGKHGYEFRTRDFP